MVAHMQVVQVLTGLGGQIGYLYQSLSFCVAVSRFCNYHAMIRTQTPRHHGSRLHTTQTNKSSKYTIYIEPNQTKKSVLQHVAQNMAHTPALTSTSTVILATPSFHRWLDDPECIAGLIGSTVTRPCRVLTGVVDSLGSSSSSQKRNTGFSVLSGDDSMLSDSIQGTVPTYTKPGRCHGYLDLVTRSHDKPMTTTLPLAHTLFSNGRDVTLNTRILTPTRRLISLSKNPETFQKINLPTQTSKITFNIPLISITPPRQILSCLGNILSEISLPSGPSPASTELEAIVPTIYRHRSESELNALGVEVWAMISPSQEFSISNIPNNTELLDIFSSRTRETDMANRTTKDLTELLKSGCELYKIESGGGGWGNKKGRLALKTLWKPNKPTTIKPDFDAFSSFLDAAIQQRGLIQSGSYLQFFVSPLWPLRILSKERIQYMSAYIFGSARKPLDDQQVQPNGPDVELVQGIFTGLSAEGTLATAKGIEVNIESPFSSVILEDA